METQASSGELNVNRNIMCTEMILSTNRNCESAAYGPYRSDEYSTGSVNESYHRDNWLVAGSWRQPLVPVTRTTNGRPIAASWVTGATN